MMDFGPIRIKHKVRAVLMIMASDALFAGQERRARFRIGDVRGGWAVAILAANVNAIRRARDVDKAAVMAVARCVTLLARWIELGPLGNEDFKGVAMPRVVPNGLVGLVTFGARIGAGDTVVA
jgi:hypothetical protein